MDSQIAGNRLEHAVTKQYNFHTNFDGNDVLVFISTVQDNVNSIDGSGEVNLISKKWLLTPQIFSVTASTFSIADGTEFYGFEQATFFYWLAIGGCNFY